MFQFFKKYGFFLLGSLCVHLVFYLVVSVNLSSQINVRPLFKESSAVQWVQSALPKAPTQVKRQKKKKVQKIEKKQSVEKAEPSVKKEAANQPSVVEKSFDQSVRVQDPPSYPRLALRRGWEGDIKLKIYINKKGTVDDVEVLNGSQYDILNKEAIRSIREWTFNPINSAGIQRYFVIKTISFRIKTL